MVTGPKHQKEKRSMEHFAGLDVSVNETSVCIVDDTGRIVCEAHQRPNGAHANRLLRIRRDRLVGQCAAEQHDELAPPHGEI